MSSPKRGSVFGGILLIAGSCIGTGMLGLPILAGFAGFYPSLIMFFCAWIFMTITGLFLVEINGWFRDRSNFITIVHKTLGDAGKIICWLTYLFLFYSLLVAYIALSGEHFASIMDLVIGRHPPKVLASIVFVLLFGWLVFMGTRHVDVVNRWMMLIKVVAFLVLIILGVSSVSKERLDYSNYNYVFFALPILVVSFGFHNMIPSLHHYLGGDRKRVQLSILGGSLLVFLVYVIWDIIALGVIPLYGENGIYDSYTTGIDAAKAIKNLKGSMLVGDAAQILAMFAILTSFLAQTLSLSHFLADGLNAKNREAPLYVALALVPPLIFAIINPNIFYNAIGFAGGICAVILFGVMPSFMLWRGRYQLEKGGKHLVPGGRLVIGLVCAFAFFILITQVTKMIKIPLFPSPIQ